MKKLHAVIICSLTIILTVFVSCSKEPVTNLQSPMSPLNPIVFMRNGFPADSLTGRQFIFNDLSWTVDSTDVVCVVNRPDLFYLPDRPLDVSINISGDQWTNVFRCPYPTDPFFFVCLSTRKS